jgi:hypothetical protein
MSYHTPHGSPALGTAFTAGSVTQKFDNRWRTKADQNEYEKTFGLQNQEEKHKTNYKIQLKQ